MPPVATIPQASRPSGFNAEHARARYRTYRGSTTYHTHSGLYAMPIARPHVPGQPSVRVVRLHDQVTYRIVTEFVERQGDWPALPSLAPKPEKGEVFQERVVTRHDPELDEGGQSRLYRMELSYVYLCTIATEETDTLTGNVAPYDSQPAGQTALPAAAFTERLVDG